MTTIDAQLTTWSDRLRVWNAKHDPLPAAVLYLAALTIAEVLTVLLVLFVGLVLHMALLFLLLLHTAATWDTPLHRFYLALAFVPLIRIVSMSLPLAGFPLAFWYMITSIPLFVAAYLVMRMLDIEGINVSLKDLSLRSVALQLAIGLTGVLLGYIEYIILRPRPLIDELTWQTLWFPALVLFISTGYLEELIFRRIMQRTAIEQLGISRGIFYIAVFFAVLHVGYKSLTDVIFVFAVGYFFGWVVYFTGSLWGVTISHGLTNTFLFLIAPFTIGAFEAPIQSLVQQSSAPRTQLIVVAENPTSTPTPDEPTPTLASALVISQVPDQGTPPDETPIRLPTALPTASPTATPSPTASATPSPTTTPTRQATATSEPTEPPPTASPTAEIAEDVIEHVVQRGQSLSILAAVYDTTEADIRDLNNLSPSSEVEPDDELRIPVPADWPSPIRTAAAGEFVRHVVQLGEYGSTIALLYSTTTDEIAALNYIGPGFRIQAGQVLRIPTEQAPAAAPATTATPAPTTAAPTDDVSQQSD